MKFALLFIASLVLLACPTHIPEEPEDNGIVVDAGDRMDTPGQPDSEEDASDEDADAGTTSTPERCGADGFPCTLAETSPEVLERSDEIGWEVYQRFDDGESVEDVVQWLAGLDGMADVAAGPNTMYFRLHQGRPTFLLTPGSLAFRHIGEAQPPVPGQPRPIVQDVVHRDRDEPEPKKALILGPYFFERGMMDSLNAAWGALGRTRGYHQLDHFTNSQVTLDQFKNWHLYDVVHLSTHGDIFCFGDTDAITGSLGADSEPREGCVTVLSTGLSIPIENVHTQISLKTRPQDSNIITLPGDHTFTPDLPGCYKFEVTVRSDHFGRRNAPCVDTVLVTVTDGSDDLHDRSASSLNCANDMGTNSLREDTNYDTNVGQPFEVIPQPRIPAGDDYKEAPGVVYLLRPARVERYGAESCRSETYCSAIRQILLTPEFFEHHYRGETAIENSMIVFGGCKTFSHRHHFAESFLSDSNLVIGYDNSMPVTESRELSSRYYQMLRQGYSADYTFETLGRQLSTDFPLCANDEPVPVNIRHSGKNLRIREIVTFVDRETGATLPRTLELEDLHEDADGSLYFTVRFDGIPASEDLSQYRIRATLDDQPHPGEWTIADTRALSDDRWLLDLEFQPSSPLGDGATFEVILELPGGGQSKDNRIIGGDCSRFSPREAPPECRCHWRGVVRGDTEERLSSRLLTLQYDPETDTYPELRILHEDSEMGVVLFFRLDPPVVRGEVGTHEALLTADSLFLGGFLTSRLYYDMTNDWLPPLTLTLEENSRILELTDTPEAVMLKGTLRGPVSRYNSITVQDEIADLDLNFQGLFSFRFGQGINCSSME